ncbi:sensor histidine kinase [Lutibacter sp. B2]|nr:sensor histidine kinase [Lutibacter sp. B2]
MDGSSLGVEKMNEIIKDTIKSIDNGRNQIFDIAESARTECKNLEFELLIIKQKAIKIINEVDELEKMEKGSRQKLLKVSKNFDKFGELDIQAAYEEAKDLQIKMVVKRNDEKDLIRQRNELEKRLKISYETVKKAENLVSQVGIAMSYLTGNLQSVFEKLENMQQKQAVAVQVINAQEEERQRIAREIHDGPAQSMANAVIKSEVCEKLFDRDVEQTKYELGQLKNLVRSSLKDVRKIIYDLRPMALDDLGLIPTLEQFIVAYQEEVNVTVDFSVCIQDNNINSTIKLVIFRIIQEALNNVKKYAKASTVLIKLEIVGKNINLLIHDDGVGFHMEKKLNSTNKESGFGLLIMKERVNLLSGEIKIQSSIGRGTRIRISIPLKTEENYE